MRLTFSHWFFLVGLSTHLVSSFVLSRQNNGQKRIYMVDESDESPEEFESAAVDWAKEQKKELLTKTKKKFAVVGGGWGGWGAAKALCQSEEDIEVTLLDALPDPTGKTPFLSKTGKPVEAGTRGFWKDYPNINALCAELELDENDIFTSFTNSSFYSPDGLEATAPVFSETKFPETTLPFLSSLSGQTFPQLPSPLGQVLATFPLFERIPLADRASMVGLLLATIDCLGNDVSVQEKYDRMTAHDLFIRFGLSERLVEDFIKPTLLVGLFKPPEELSALVVMELLYYYALAHQDSFDVRWIKNGTVSDSLIAPLAESLENEYGLNVFGGSRVNKISLDDNDKTCIEYSGKDGKTKTLEVDGVILALNGKGMASVIESSPDLSKFPTFSKAASMKNGIDVISTRIWLDRYVPTRTPANVFSRFDALRGSGGTFFMLDQLQEENEEGLWGGDEVQGSVLACDFYNSGALMSLSDEKIIDILMNDLLPEAVPEFRDAKVVDSWVGKFPGTVSFFYPGSFDRRPPMQGDQSVPQIKFAGDWVRMGDQEHGAKGLCQERAYVSGLQAANLLLDEVIGKSRLYKHPVFPVREDEAQFKAGIELNKQVMKVVPRFWPHGRPSARGLEHTINPISYPNEGKMKFSSVAVGIVLMTSSHFPLGASMKASETRLGRLRRQLADTHDHDHENENCVEHEIDFVLVEDDAIRASVEDEIVHMLEKVGIKVNTRKLSKEEYNAAEQAGDFHLSFSETWGAPYDPHAYASGWVAQDEGHFQALASLEAPDTRESLFEQINDVLKEESHTQRTKKWEAIHKVVHDNAVMLPLWGARIPTVLNSKRLTRYQPGNQQFDYPVDRLHVLEGSKTVTIAPGAQTGRFVSVGRLDPHTYRPNEFFANNWVYEGLVSYGSYGQILPALASSWTIEEKDDGGQRYIFQLQPNVLFHDGAPWNCAAAKLNFDHVLAKPLRSPDWHGWYGLMSQIESWDCSSDMEFIVETKNKYYPFLQELSFIRPLRMLSPSSFVGTADPFAENSCHTGWGSIEDAEGGPTVVCAGIKSISGTGPFMFDSRSPKTTSDGEEVDGEVIFKQNPTYWDGVPSIESLVIKHYESSEEVKAALLDGSLDLVWGGGVLTAQDLVSLEEDENNDLSVFHSEDIQNVIVMLNSGNPPLDDINVRKTIIHAIDKKTIIDDNLGGIFKPVDNVFPMDAPYCDVDLTPRWDYDFEKAEFLNCPVKPEAEVEIQIQKQLEKDKTFAVALGVGLGVSCVIMALLTFVYVRRSNRLEKEMQAMLMKVEQEENGKVSK